MSYDTDDWVEHVRRTLVPMIEQSEVALSIAPQDFEDEVDVRFALELGISILLNKPIILAVRPSWPMPAKLLRVADRLVEMPLDERALADVITTALHGPSVVDTATVERITEDEGLVVHDPEPYLIADEASSVIVEGMDPDGSHYQRLVLVEFAGRTHDETPATARVMMAIDGALTVGRMIVDTATEEPGGTAR